MLNLVWLRRDLRLEDNAALYYALKSPYPVVCVFIFDTNILNELDKKDARVQFIHQSLQHLQTQLETLGSSLLVYKGEPLEIWQQLVNEHSIHTVFTNRDYEPYAQQRDASIDIFLQSRQIQFQTYKDHVIFEQLEITKNDGKPYHVFTPYSKQWKLKLHSQQDKNGALFYLKSYPTEKYFHNLLKINTKAIPSLQELGFEKSDIPLHERKITLSLIQQYHETRDFPAQKGTSKLGLHLRFGTLSIRKLATIALQHNETFLNELIWRDFYSMILANYPKVVTESFHKEYDAIEWRNDEKEFEQWCKGKTGYPLVDAGMRELNATGFMHNRVRMLVASFLTKHLLIDWRWGEAYFAKKLLDFDLASNNGGWQWAAGCGTDAAPYFRIFSPDAQQLKFDKQQVYIKKWVPELGTSKYPKPIVEHTVARVRCLAAFQKALKKEDEIAPDNTNTLF